MCLGGRQIKEDDIPSVQKGKMFVFVPGVFLKIKILQRDMISCNISTGQE
jgi:hypothetical protein